MFILDAQNKHHWRALWSPNSFRTLEKSYWFAKWTMEPRGRRKYLHKQSDANLVFPQRNRERKSEEGKQFWDLWYPVNFSFILLVRKPWVPLANTNLLLFISPAFKNYICSQKKKKKRAIHVCETKQTNIKQQTKGFSSHACQLSAHWHAVLSSVFII